MRIDFSTIKEFRVPEGVVTQIADESGRVLWALSGGKIVLEVEKVTKTTKAGSTTYSSEQFIILDIYPKTNGTVKVTYGGLTKTITDTSGVADPNAVQVYFGTLYGLADSVATPASGELTIEGDCVAFGCSRFTNQKSNNELAGGITAVKDMGKVKYIPTDAFSACYKITSCEIPNTVTSIGNNAFCCDDITAGKYSQLLHIVIPESVTSIGEYAFFVMDGSPNERTVVMLSTTPPTLISEGSIDQTAFSPLGKNKIIVPKGCGDIYKSAESWSYYADYITEAS